jgi:hypothetical protein
VQGIVKYKNSLVTVDRKGMNDVPCGTTPPLFSWRTIRRRFDQICV